MVEQAGVLALPETELRAEVWTADATATLPALSELVGLDAVLLACVSEHKDPSARVQQATLVAAPRDMAAAAPGRQVGRARGLRRRGAPARRACRGGGRDPRRAGWGTRGRRQGTLGGSWVVPGRRALAARLAGHPRLRRHRTGAATSSLELSCILRTPTAQGDVYFKAVGSPRCSSMKRWNCAGRAVPDHVPAPSPSTPSTAGWLLPTLVRSWGGTPPLRSARTCCVPSPGCRSKRSPRSTGCSGQAAWTVGWLGWPPRRNAGCRRSTR